MQILHTKGGTQFVEMSPIDTADTVRVFRRRRGDRRDGFDAGTQFMQKSVRSYVPRDE
jgi:hypothetical protein